MKKTPLFFSVLTIIVVAAVIIYSQAEEDHSYKPGIWPEADQAVNQAKLIFSHAKQRGESFENGPCLSEALMQNWVADVVHNPRQAVDDIPQNQCGAIVTGGAKHIVELDLDGNVVRVK